MRILQISDTHMSPTKPHFNANWQPVKDYILDIKPDMIIHTGDLSIDGADKDEDLQFGIERMRSLNIPFAIIPGNHDVGHLNGAFQPVDDIRIARWQNIIGPDHWFHDIDNWRLIGLNSLFIGLNDVRDNAQQNWLKQTLDASKDKNIAIFAHKPLFMDSPTEGETGYWGIEPKKRQELLDLFAQYRVKLHASGHIHKSHKAHHNGTDFIWTAPTSYIVECNETALPGVNCLGAIMHEFTKDNVTSTPISIPGLQKFIIDDIIGEIYPMHSTSGDKK
ncbi:metallophosphoesterase family protein [Bartonella sp. HY406]|uniref:metallophosphoesterase family protein n=1 Tax=Bartonella sp. HY406 TaxID=2979331 RepID=UPI0021C638FC|nr:metallophosphoesterase [Bartonella sp. HY406]UXN04196.1 metallophosphoesterase [Bartonella sp. HY406]